MNIPHATREFHGIEYRVTFSSCTRMPRARLRPVKVRRGLPTRPRLDHRSPGFRVPATGRRGYHVQRLPKGTCASWSAVACHRFGRTEQAERSATRIRSLRLSAKPKRWQATALQDAAALPRQSAGDAQAARAGAASRVSGYRQKKREEQAGRERRSRERQAR